MAEEQKNVEVPKDLKAEENVAPAIATTEPATEEATTAAATTTTDKPTEETTKAEEATTDDKATEEAKAEEKKEEVKPIEEGQLGHKAQGASFPKNLIASKEFFFFGNDAYEPKTLSSYLKNEKSTEVYHSNVAWASETGKGLLFSGDKKAPSGVINLSNATEPETDGPNKFSITAKGNKHTFKAANTAERDNWVAQLKLKIAEAKELSESVVESETYKKTLESFKPAPVAKKEDKTTAPAAAATEGDKEETKVEEPTKEPVKEDEATKEAEEVKEEPKAEKAESPKPSKSKRASFFGFLEKKDSKTDEKKEEKKEDDKKDEPKVEDKTEDTTTANPVAAAVVPTAEEAIVADESKPEAEAVKTEEEKTTEEATKPAESPKEKTSKRNSFFGGLMSKKEKKATEAKTPDATEAPKDVDASKNADDDAPVIPPVEATTPLAVAVNNDSQAPTTVETPETTTAAATTEAKKDPKEKRKSSIPFLGKREKSPAPAEGEEKSPKSSAFSKLRATIKGKSSAPKAEDKTEKAEKTEEEAKKDDEVKVGETAEVKVGETAEAKDETKGETAPEPAKVEDPVTEEIKTAETDGASKPAETVTTTTPAVTAAA